MISWHTLGSMKNFHLPLPDQTYDLLKAESERTKSPATSLAREAIDQWLRAQRRKATHDAISAYAEEMAGTQFDLDPDLEAAGIEFMLKTGNKQR